MAKNKNLSKLKFSSPFGRPAPAGSAVRPLGKNWTPEPYLKPFDLKMISTKPGDFEGIDAKRAVDEILAFASKQLAEGSFGRSLGVRLTVGKRLLCVEGFDIPCSSKTFALRLHVASLEVVQPAANFAIQREMAKRAENGVVRIPGPRVALVAHGEPFLEWRYVSEEQATAILEEEALLLEITVPSARAKRAAL